MKRLQLLLIIFTLNFSISAKEYHVSKTGIDKNQGTFDFPFLTIQTAAQLAQPGDVIVVHEGVYRERVIPPRGGISNAQRIIYKAAEDEKVVIKGSERINNWKLIGHDTWKVVIPNTFFGDFNPYNDIIHGEWYKTPKDGYNRHTGAVYLNEEWLTEASNLDSVLQLAGAEMFWFSRVEDENTTIWAQFKEIDPNKELVEINVRQSVFYPERPGRNYITVDGFVMRQAATPWSGAMSEQKGLIGTHWSKGWIIENNIISHSMNTGITLGRYEMEDNLMPPATAEGFVESLELALDDGWSKELIGNHIVRNNHISQCEKNGIHGSLGGIFSTIEGNTICDIATQEWIGGADVAGLKLLASQDVLIRCNHVYRCGGYGGIWLDWMTQGTRVTGNLLHDNRRQDLFVEVNHGPFLVDNNIFLSSVGLLESSGGGAYVHNLFGCQIKLRVEEDRETPFHKAHSTEKLGLSKVIGDDERFHNNLFVGHDGLSVYDAWAAVNLQAIGNVYLSGSNPSTHDREVLVVSDFDPGIKLEERANGWWLEILVNPTWVFAQNRAVVTTEALGRAMVPNALYEKPDGSPFRLDMDYLGNQRNVKNPAPGPIKFSEKNQVIIQVWPTKFN